MYVWSVVRKVVAHVLMQIQEKKNERKNKNSDPFVKLLLPET